MPRSASSANRRGVALLSVALVATACTSMLGIDGNYSSVEASSGGSSGGKTSGTGGKPSAEPKAGGASNLEHHDAGSTGSGGAPGNGGTTSFGGSTQDASTGGHTSVGGGEASAASGGASSGGHENGGSGGTSGSGGNGTGGDGAGGRGSGGTEQDGGEPTPICPVATFMGTYSGNFHPSTGITLAAAEITGSLTLHFTVSATSSTLRTITGGVAFLPTQTSGGFAGTFLGSFDCEKQTGSITLVDPTNITTIMPPEVVVPIDGTFQVVPGPDGEVRGTFSIHESLNLAATGSGTWEAK
jgi:hypothetical protein